MKKGRPKKAATSFKIAPAVEKIAAELIGLFHPHLQEEGVRIVYLFRSDTPKAKGKATWGKVEKTTSLKAFFGRAEGEEVSKPFFTMVISEPIWCHLDPKQRVALVDHELCHLTVKHDNDGNLLLGTIGHDLEEFRAVIERHGDWNRDAKLMMETMENAPRFQTEMKMEE